MTNKFPMSLFILKLSLRLMLPTRNLQDHATLRERGLVRQINHQVGADTGFRKGGGGDPGN